MIETHTVTTKVSNLEIVSKHCDWCGKVGEKSYLFGDITTFRVDFGFGSTMYDGEVFTFDICDECFTTHLKPRATR
jgi:hypothetical protein